MRLLVNCPSGDSRLLQLEDDATVLELKQTLLEEEGIPVAQQVLCHAGQHLKDHLSLADHQLEEYTLSNEVVLYLTRVLAAPKLIYLCSRSKPSQRVPEMVEADLPVGEVKQLLLSRGLAGTFPGIDTPLLAKRQDGSTIPIAIIATEGLTQLQGRIGRQEGVEPTTLTFKQGQDGALHIHVQPSAESSKDTYPVYERSFQPQPVMPNKTKELTVNHVPLPVLRDELCVLPYA